MSAFRVEKGHIDVLVNALIEADFISPDDAKAVGTRLWRENYASVNARYDEDEMPPEYVPELDTEKRGLGKEHVISAAECYEYQSCEHGAWSHSYARLITNALVTAAKEDFFEESDARGEWHYRSLSQALVAK